MNYNIQKAYSIDEIFERVSEYDLVITAEKPLADALNSRLDKPQLGNFAFTPDKLVCEQNPESRKKEEELFLKLLHSSNLGWKEASYLVNNICSCWKETGHAEKIVQFNQFDNKVTKKALKIVTETPSVFRALQKFEVDPELKVATVGLYQFSTLEKSILPQDFDNYPFLSSGKTKKLPPVRIFDSIQQLTLSVKRNITQNNANDIALVINPQTPYQAFVRSIFEMEDIPYHKRLPFSENERLRSFLDFSQLVLTSPSALKVKDVTPILQLLGWEKPSTKYGNRSIADIEDEEITQLREIFDRMSTASFKDILEFLPQTENGKAEEKLERLLKNLNLFHQPVTEKRINNIKYYLETYSTVADETHKGVILTSPKTATHIDREIIFCIGLDETWAQQPPYQPWIDKREIRDRNVDNFKVLLQNGNYQYLLVQQKLLGEKVVPCYYFNEIVDRTISSFFDFPHIEHSTASPKQPSAFPKKDINLEHTNQETLSPSELNLLVQCPRQVYFKQLIPMEENRWIMRGNLFHQFAEFHISHPQFVKNEGIKTFVEIMIDELKSLIPQEQIPLLRTELTFGVKNIMDYIENSFSNPQPVKHFYKKSTDNIFAEKFQMGTNKQFSEMSFRNSRLGCRGRVDLIVKPSHLVDFKSGNKKTAHWIVRNSNVDLFEEEPDFQALLYLAHLRDIYPQQKLKFSFVYFLSEIDKSLLDEPDRKNSVVTITYYPYTFNQQISNRETYKYLQGAQNRRRILEPLGYDNYSKIFQNIYLKQSNQYRKDLTVENHLQPLIQECENYLSIGRGKQVTARQLKRGCKSILKKLVRFRKENFFKEDLDSFRAFLQKWLSRYNEYSQSRFPVGEVDLNSLQKEWRDLIIQ